MTIIDKKEFIRSFAIRCDNVFNLFLGAGISLGLFLRFLAKSAI